jgi:hypothetical protein
VRPYCPRQAHEHLASAASELLEPFRQQEDQLLVSQPFERPHGKIHGYLASIIALEGDRHARWANPAIGKTAGPCGFESAPVQTCSIGESTHLANILLPRPNSRIAVNDGTENSHRVRSSERATICATCSG